jgi:hypothetical protein
MCLIFLRDRLKFINRVDTHATSDVTIHDTIHLLQLGEW